MSNGLVLRKVGLTDEFYLIQVFQIDEKGECTVDSR